MKKILILSFIIAICASFLLVSPGKSKLMPYYGGEAISYNGKVFISTTNTKAFELFTLENGKIYKKATIQSTDRESNEFYDSKFVIEDGKLYAYLTNGRYLYKYDITNPMAPKVENKIKDNSWDWFSRIKIVDGKLATIGTKGLKIWNEDMQVVNSYNLEANGLDNKKDPGNLLISDKGGFLIAGKKDEVKVFDARARVNIANFKININEEANRNFVNDSFDGLIYIVDDESLKAFDFSGNIKKEFKHISHVGYDVVKSNNPNYLYFSDGIGVVKVRKSDLEPVDWKKTTDLGGWAIGIKSVMNGGKENLVVFNCNNIVVLNENLEQIDAYESTEVDIRPVEELYLGIDKNRSAAGSKVSLRGGGFGLSEELEIKFAKTSYTAKTDQFGRFKQIITVPSVLPTKTDIKVIGKSSGRTYSIAFEIE